MKLIRFGAPGREKPGVLLPDGRRVDASSFIVDYDEEFFGSDGLARLERWLRNAGASAPEVPADARLGPPVARPSKIVCIGLNFRDHAAETGAKIPEEPIVFLKATSALAGPDDDVIIPRHSEKTDWEVELGVVIGKRASYVSEADAMSHVAGYVLHNDYSERAFQLERGGQWVKGKSCDTFAPLGPFLATRDEIADPHALRMWLRVNGETMQDGTSADMIFGVPKLVSYLSEFMSLLPGDVVSTGTPAGVGLGMKPPRFLKPGDEVELGIDGLGTSKQRLRACR
ncbi:fumarylacetoacetate (FAA) hydrolase (plasmid) [Gemmatirosa kalamazoonensis]|uniref:Fumarylacetoacetate (FAA) hydrolase n=1 Tax=Gemmatirosa kalamazoonensis TaxID=861299 RepID=W0RU73_9BACT|nr:fumarylacetoacetate hydrolase family protein [Gemmatirosa kalamazoonensis]AHG93138.1 fumarylacetoacetate (FAA) hydrolase [Gemmatirosa kalamazoonensis]